MRIVTSLSGPVIGIIGASLLLAACDDGGTNGASPHVIKDKSDRYDVTVNQRIVSRPDCNPSYSACIVVFTDDNGCEYFLTSSSADAAASLEYRVGSCPAIANPPPAAVDIGAIVDQLSADRQDEQQQQLLDQIDDLESRLNTLRNRAGIDTTVSQIVEPQLRELTDDQLRDIAILERDKVRQQLEELQRSHTEVLNNAREQTLVDRRLSPHSSGTETMIYDLNSTDGWDCNDNKCTKID